MKSHLLTPIAAAIILAAFTGGGLAAAAPLEAYSRLPAIENVTVSPDGSQVAMVVTDGQQRAVAVHDRRTKSIRAKANFGETSVQAIRWAGEDHLLITTAVSFDPPNVSGGLRNWRRVHDFNVTTQSLRPLLGDVEGGLSNIQRTPQVRTVGGKPLVLVEGIQFVQRRGHVALFRIDLETGRSQVVEPALTGTRRWLAGPEGRAVARELYDETRRTWTLEVRNQDVWRAVHATSVPGDAADLIGFGADGRSVIYRARDPASEVVYHEVNTNGAPSANPPRRLPRAHRVLVDPQTGRFLGHYGWDGDTHAVVYFDPQDQATMDVVRSTYAAVSASVGTWSNDRKTVVAYIDRPGRSPAHAIFDMTAKRAEWLGADHPEIGEGDVGAQSRVRFKAGDGLELAGYLTRPPRRAAEKKLPLVVYVHDGPAERDTPGFDWVTQAIASRGYAVLQVNYRGSAEITPELQRAGEGQIGRKMQSDLADGVRALAATEAIDPDRVCIAGFGYGGYAAVAGVTVDPGPYRCAAALGGYFELVWPKAGAEPGTFRAVSIARAWGVTGAADPRLVQYSPVRQAAKASAPILLVHGKMDTSRPAANSQEMAAALRKAGKPVDLVILEEGDRRLTNGDAGIQALNALVTFLEKHNPPN